MLLGLEDERRLLHVDGANAPPPIVSRDKTNKPRRQAEFNKQGFNPIRGATILSACGSGLQEFHVPGLECAAAAAELMRSHFRLSSSEGSEASEHLRGDIDIFLCSRHAACLFYSKQRGQQRGRKPHIKERNISFFYSLYLP